MLDKYTPHTNLGRRENLRVTWAHPISEAVMPTTRAQTVDAATAKGAHQRVERLEILERRPDGAHVRYSVDPEEYQAIRGRDQVDRRLQDEHRYRRGAKRPLSASPPPKGRKRGRKTAVPTTSQPIAARTEYGSQRGNTGQAQLPENHQSKSSRHSGTSRIVMQPLRSTNRRRNKAFAKAQLSYPTRQQFDIPGDIDAGLVDSEGNETTDFDRLQLEYGTSVDIRMGRVRSEIESVQEEAESTPREEVMSLGVAQVAGRAAITSEPRLRLEDVVARQDALPEESRIGRWVERQREQAKLEKLNTEANRVREWGNFIVSQEKKLKELYRQMEEMGHL